MKNAMTQASNRPISKRPKRQQLYYIYKMIMNRWNFEYSLNQAIKYFFKCNNFRSAKWLKEKPQRKVDLFLNKGIEKLKWDLDIV